MLDKASACMQYPGRPGCGLFWLVSGPSSELPPSPRATIRASWKLTSSSPATIHTRPRRFCPSSSVSETRRWRRVSLPKSDSRYGTTIIRAIQFKTTEYDVRFANFSSSDPYYEYRGFVMFNVEGTWQIRYTVEWFSCTEDSFKYPYKIPSNNTSNAIIFTTKNSGQSVDLVAATNGQNCSSHGGVAINVTDTLNSTGISKWPGGGTCAVAVSSTVTPDPCQIKVSEAEASSISASVTARACEAQNPPIECPSGNDGDENDAGHGLVVGGLVCLAAALGAIFHILI
ncbi:hypothetical protein BDP81DRAFT_441130 [Colletotrichum phormii]|uniref:DUF7136 domain-containing protein n=1 Tax=Colletotrichum phormii TaxID=359342 RepID=A0AAJ0EAG7_9PEZI|nr:uncharacterized protein BDP81DRAFT_441130 [Colletotrichum phormii]KAK1622667.1 hypothetical protein BDP81DRAFT_441130 [Colletotrichum phormii]